MHMCSSGLPSCRSAGGIEQLVLLLEQSDDRTAIKNAASALAELAKSNPDNKAAVREAKGIQVDPSLHWLQLTVSLAGNARCWPLLQGMLKLLEASPDDKHLVQEVSRSFPHY